MIIGQKVLLNKIDKLLNNFPRFSIIVGNRGCGKKLICRYIYDKLNIPIIQCDQKIDTVRKIIGLSYEQTKPICYSFLDADSMTIGAKNSLLKITEEPPKSAYFCLTLNSIDNMLDTILSRATVFKLDKYNYEDLRQYMKLKSCTDDLALTICSDTGDINNLIKSNVKFFYSYANTIVENIDKINSGNVFKLSNNLKLKESDEGYDCKLMFRLVRNLFLEKAKNFKQSKYLHASLSTTKLLKELEIPNLNKQASIDMWIMDVRKCLR